MEKYIITGGPCTGKTTMIEQIAREGFRTIEECAREIIQEEEAKIRQGYWGIFPWDSLKEFQSLVIKRQLNKEKRIYGPVFLDRSIIDNIAYAELGKISLDSHIYSCMRSAGYTKAFILDQLLFYKQDQERKEGKKEAKQVHEKICEVYHRSGLEIIHVPAMGIEERVRFILSRLR